MKLMQEVGFFAIFVGIESPDEATLIHMQKRQNTHRSIAESVHKIYQHGMFVNAGFILGFDTEPGSVAGALVECIEATAIPVNMAGLLFALPTTQLARRLAREGRLHQSFDVQLDDSCADQCTSGLNFTTCRPRADILRDYLTVVENIYAPQAFFERVRRTVAEMDSSKRHFKPTFRHQMKELKGFARMIWKLGTSGETARYFWRVIGRTLVENPRSIRYAGSLMALYLHFGPFSKYVAARIRAEIAREERNPSPVAARAPEPVEHQVPVAVAG
jgi:hypothetical protein